MFDFLIVSFVFPAGERARTDSKIEDESVVHATCVVDNERRTDDENTEGPFLLKRSKSQQSTDDSLDSLNRDE